MLRAKFGRIVNMSSAVALHGNAGQTVYAASKTALLGLTTSLAREVGAKGITVNAVCPGLVDTEMTSHLDEKARAHYVDQTPVGTDRHPRGGRRRGPIPDVGRGVVRERSRDPWSTAASPRSRVGARPSTLLRTGSTSGIEEGNGWIVRRSRCRVKKVLAEQLAVDEAQVVADARFAEDLNADSLDLVEAVLALEEEWSIEIPEDEMESVKTVGQAVDMVVSKLGGS